MNIGLSKIIIINYYYYFNFVLNQGFGIFTTSTSLLTYLEISLTFSFLFWLSSTNFRCQLLPSYTFEVCCSCFLFTRSYLNVTWLYVIYLN